MIPAIPTRHAGVLMRSRLEARYAVFFDRLGIRWEYEPQGFLLPSGDGYLPDFWLPDLGCYVEVKPTGGDFGKAEELAKASGLPVWCCEGPPAVRWDRFAGGMWPVALYHPGKRRLWWGFGEESCGDVGESPDLRRAVSAALSARFGT